jgi:ribosomal protein S18 acetylase RimI-like enzyme
MNIREYAQSDQQGVIALWSECGLVVPWNDPAQDIARKLVVDRELFLVGVNDGVLVGTVMGGYDGHRGWVNYLAVKPSEQGRGYGRQLIQGLESLLKARGCPKINLQVRAANAAAIAFYRALGYCVDDVVSLGKRLERDG